MPAVSQKQQKFFGIVRAIQKGEMAPTTPETAKAAADMKKKDVKDFASTKHKGLPEKKVTKEGYYGMAGGMGSSRSKNLRNDPDHQKSKEKVDSLLDAVRRGREKRKKDVKMNEESNPRIPRKKGQKANSKKHSDLYTDENPKGTIHGLGFKDVETAKASVSKIRNSSRSHAHKIQAAVAMEQRAREMGKSSEAAIYRKYINSMKKKTKKMDEGYTNTDNEERIKRYDDEKKKFAKIDQKMKFGKFYAKAKEAKERLRPGEVRRYDKEKGKYVSNKD